MNLQLCDGYSPIGTPPALFSLSGNFAVTFIETGSVFTKQTNLGCYASSALDAGKKPWRFGRVVCTKAALAAY